jgi:hypothetical protein
MRNIVTLEPALVRHFGISYTHNTSWTVPSRAVPSPWAPVMRTARCNA